MKKAERMDKPELSDEQMKAVLVAKQQARVKLAGEELQKLCEKFKVNIVPKCELTQGSVTMSLSIVPTE